MVRGVLKLTLTAVRLCALCLCLALPLLAQSGVQVSSSLSEASVALDGTVTLTVSVSGAAEGVDVPLPETRDGGLRFMPAGRRYQMTNMNGQMSSSTQYDFVVMPIKTGRHLIEPMTVVVNGVAHTTPSQRLEVTDMASASAYPSAALPPSEPLWPGLPPQPREDDVMLESTVEPETIYKHQPFYYRLTLLSAVRLLSDPRYNAIAPTGFLRVPFEQVNDQAYRGGRSYDTSSVTTAFFPLSEGEYSLPGTQIQVTPSSFGLPRLLRTQPHTIKVLPLPSEGRPKSFTGAVGTRFDILSRLKQNTVTAGSSVELEVEVEGDGHLDLVPYAYLPEWEGIEKKLGKSPSQTRAEGGKIRSHRTYSYRLKPSKAGTYELSGIALAFFNPQAGRYETVLAPTVSLTVEDNPGLPSPGHDPQPSALPESSRPVELAGPEDARLPMLPRKHLAAGLALMLLGWALARPLRLTPRRARQGPRFKLGTHASHQELLESLERLAPGEDRVVRSARLRQQGWSAEQVEAFEALRQKTAHAVFGHGSSKESQLSQLEQALSALLKEVKP